MVQISIRNRLTPEEQRLPLLPPEVTQRLKAFAMRLQGAVLFLLGLAFMAALASYDPNDPSMNTAVTARDEVISYSNWLDMPGAISTDLVLQWLGSLAGWMVALLLVIHGARQVRYPGPFRVRLGRFVLPFILSLAFSGLGLALLSLHGQLPMEGMRVGALWLVVANAADELALGYLGATGVMLASAGLLFSGVMLFLVAAGITLGEASASATLLARISMPFGRMAGRAAYGVAGSLRRRDSGSDGEEPEDDDEDERAESDEDDDAPLTPKLQARPVGGPKLSLPGRKPAAVEIDAEAAARRKAEAEKTAQTSLGFAKPQEPARKAAAVATGTEDYEAPPLSLLHAPSAAELADLPSEDALQANAGLLEGVLADFGVKGEIQKVRPGPVVTLYELEPAPGTKSQRVIGIADDIARSMSAVSARVAVVPGKNAIGIELPNETRQTVWLHEVLSDASYLKTKARLPLALGKDIGGEPVTADLARMPHLLVAGTTGSGKSVAVNTMILSLLYKLSPEQCRFIMIDPKMLELSVYADIPHLLCPVVTEPKKAVVALKWVVREMEDRYRAMSKLSVRNIDGYNQRVNEARAKGEVLTRKVQTGFDPDTGKPVIEEEPIDLSELPYIVVIVDEFADLMLVAGKEIEAAIQRLAQMARAAGIHLIMATQRPSVDVITGTIKANFPTRISFAVTSKIDSRTILGEQGAEQLLGMGDMLYMAAGGRIARVHGPFVKDEEVEHIVKHLRTLGPPAYIEAVTDDNGFEDSEMLAAAIGDGGSFGGEGEGGDDLFDKAVDLVARERKASTSFIQRHLQIGYNRAARIIEEMEKQGMVSAANHVGKREILLPDRRGDE
jgi:DNA segregation ATPase FtsK/SpoIIIE, S-DNA-T family